MRISGSFQDSSAESGFGRERPSLEQDEEIVRLRAELARLQERVAELEALVEIDPLCGVPNRRGVARAVGLAISHADRHGTPVVLALLDLDGFKAVNDRLGHAAGDQMLQDVARLLAGGVRSSDFVGRLGGDEFVLILWHAHPGQASRRLRALCRRLARLQPPLAASFGLVEILPGSAPSELLERADRLMYRDKAARKARAAARRTLVEVERSAEPWPPLSGEELPSFTHNAVSSAGRAKSTSSEARREG